jgi:hypothetical protein
MQNVSPGDGVSLSELTGMTERAAGAAFNGSGICLFVAALTLFIIWMPWSDCKPLSEFDAASHPDLSIPADAECFSNSHGSVAFLSERGQWRATKLYLSIDAFLLLPACIGSIYYLTGSRRSPANSETDSRPR